MPSVAQFSSQSAIGAQGRKSLSKTKVLLWGESEKLHFKAESVVTAFCVGASVFHLSQQFCNKQHQLSLWSRLEGMTAWSSSTRICYPPLQGNNPQGRLGHQLGPSNQNCCPALVSHGPWAQALLYTLRRTISFCQGCKLCHQEWFTFPANPALG